MSVCWRKLSAESLGGSCLEPSLTNDLGLLSAVSLCLPNVARPASTSSVLSPRLDSTLLLALGRRLRMSPAVSEEVAREEIDAESVLPLADPLLFVCFPHTTLLCAGFVLPIRDVFDDGLRPIAGDRVGVCAGVCIENSRGPPPISGMSSPLSSSNMSIAARVGRRHTLHVSGRCPCPLHTTHFIIVWRSSS